MADKTFKVTGAQKFMGHGPDETFKADPDDRSIQRAVEGGWITEQQPKKNQATPTASHDDEEKD